MGAYILWGKNREALVIVVVIVVVVVAAAAAVVVHTKETKYMSRDNAGQYHNICTGNKAFERVEQFKYQGTTLTNQNSIHEEIKSMLKLRNACYHSVQKLLFFSLLSKNVKI